MADHPAFQAPTCEYRCQFERLCRWRELCGLAAVAIPVGWRRHIGRLFTGAVIDAEAPVPPARRRSFAGKLGVVGFLSSPPDCFPSIVLHFPTPIPVKVSNTVALGDQCGGNGRQNGRSGGI
jgi:hypothetical protein